MILGLDPSLRNFGWVLMEDEGTFLRQRNDGDRGEYDLCREVHLS